MTEQLRVRVKLIKIQMELIRIKQIQQPMATVRFVAMQVNKGKIRRAMQVLPRKVAKIRQNVSRTTIVQ